MGKILKVKFTRVALLLAVALVFTSFFGTPLTAYAAAPTKPDDASKSYIWYKAIEKCFSDAVIVNGTSLENISSYKWFTDTSVYVGILNTGDSIGTANCNDTNMISNAMTYWGYSDPVTAWCSVMQFAGPYRSNVDKRDCVTGDGTFLTGGPGDNVESRPTSFKRAIETGFYQSTTGEPQLSAPTKYYLYYQSFTSLCGAKPVVKVSEANPTQKALIGTPKAFQIRFVNADKVVEDWIYQTTDKTATDNVGIFEGDGGGGNPGGNPTCQEMADAISANSDQFAAYAKLTNFGAPVATPAGTDAAGSGTSTCGVKGGFGWVICPVTNFLADMVDTMYTYIQDQLEIPADLFSTDPGTYTAWQVFRDYANIAFILAFLAIVYSQVTSVAISNYGIKKMLPRLIIAALLVNISYFICQLAVDVTNLMGHGIKNLFDGVGDAVTKGTLTDIGATGTDGNGGFATLIAGILVGGVILVVALALGLIAPILIAVAMVFLILLIRKAFIVILIAISPLAFVAYLLPNTEKWFQKWWSAFSKLLLVFPIVAVVVGGSQVASKIISAQAANPNTPAGGTAVNSLIAAGILTVPFFVIPGLLKKSLEATGAIGAKFQKWGDKATGKVGKQAREGYNKTSYAQGKKLREAGKEQYKRRKFAERVTGGNGARGWATRRFARGGAGLAPSGLRTAGTQAGLSTLSQSAQAQADEGFEKDVKAAGLGYATQSSGDVMKQLVDSSGNISSSLSSAERAAAIDRVMSTGSFGERRALVEATQSMSDGEKARTSKAVYAKGDQNIFGSGIGAKIQSKDGVKGADDLRKITRDNIAGGHVNADHLVQGEGSAEYMADVALGQKDQLDASGKAMLDASGRKVKTAASVAGDATAQTKLRDAAAKARTTSGTTAKASADAMDHQLNRL